MFERFTERARQVVVLAQDEARALGHNYIGTEHILLGLLREEEAIAARVLEARKVSVEEVRAQVGRIVGHGDARASGQIPFTPRAKKVLELSLREALTLGHNHIGPEHILLGLAREGGGLAAQILLDFGASPRTVAEDVLELLGGKPAHPLYTESFAVDVQERDRSGERPWSSLRPIDRRLSKAALALGWALFGIAFAIGLFAGWLIWG
jgi:ATP-dependent Clp protease ATP-binding subunit ClpC